MQVKNIFHVNPKNVVFILSCFGLVVGITSWRLFYHSASKSLHHNVQVRNNRGALLLNSKRRLANSRCKLNISQFKMCAEDQQIGEVCWRLSNSLCVLKTSEFQMWIEVYWIADVCWRLFDCRCMLKIIWLQICVEGYLIADVVLKTIGLQMCVEDYLIAELCWGISNWDVCWKLLYCRVYWRLSDCRCVLETIVLQSVLKAIWL